MWILEARLELGRNGEGLDKNFALLGKVSDGFRVLLCDES